MVLKGMKVERRLLINELVCRGVSREEEFIEMEKNGRKF